MIDIEFGGTNPESGVFNASVSLDVTITDPEDIIYSALEDVLNSEDGKLLEEAYDLVSEGKGGTDLESFEDI